MRLEAVAGVDVEREWVEQWRDAMQRAIRKLLNDVEARFGFEPDEHRLDGPASAAELAGLVARHGDGLPAELLMFHEFIADVQLPDVNNGYWIHRPPTAGESHGHPDTLTDGRRIVVFGSDGGGALFALTAETGTPVLRLAEGANINGVYDADRAVVIANDLRQFLTVLLAETERLLRREASYDECGSAK